MAVYLLLDTNILLRLASKTDPSTLLQHLDRLVKGNHVKLLVPDTLKKEWQKHGDQQKENITNKLKRTQKDARERAWGTSENNEFTDKQLRVKEQTLHKQIDLIDDLINNHGIHIPITAEILMAVHKQKESKKAPFHKKDSTNDAQIAFSAMSFLESENVSDFYFVSHNKTDFSVEQESQLMLHPDIQNLFPGVLARYFEHIRNAFEYLAQLGLPVYDDSIKAIPNRIKVEIKADRAKKLIDQLYEYIEKRSLQLMFHPKNILLEHCPFITADAFTLHHRPFTVITDNQQLYRLLSSVLVTDTEVIPTHPNPLVLSPEEKERVAKIIKFLRFNLLENVAFERNNSVPITFQRGDKECYCPVCTYKRFDFKTLTALLQTPSTDRKETVDDMLRRAYGLYKFGKFGDAAQVLIALKKDWKDSKNLKYYIVCMNLVNLGFIIRQSYPTGNHLADIIKDINKIDLDEIYAECLNSGYQSVLDWLHEKKFFSENFTGLHTTLKKITDQFQARNTGFNDNTNQLIEYYFSCERFLSANSIIYDIFGDFHLLTDLFTEGLFASYGCNDFLSGKLTYLSDDLIEKLLVYGKAADMIKYFRRYKLESIRYRADTVGTTTKDRIKMLVASYSVIAENYEKDRERFQEYFWDNYSDLIFNALTVLGIVKMSAEDLNSVALDICELLERSNHIHYFHLSRFLQFFVFQNKEVLSEELLTRFFILGINDDYLTPDNFTDNLKIAIQQRGIKINIPVPAFKRFAEVFMNLNADQRAFSWHVIGNVFSITSNKEQKAAIKKFVEASLAASFYGRNFYLAALFDIIESNEKYFGLYTEEIAAIISRGEQQRSFNNSKFYIDVRVSEYFNFLFKYGIPLPEKIKTILPKIGNYYIWLSDPDSFNYSLFDRNWLDHYFTLHFKKYLRKSKVLKQFLLTSFKAKPDLDLEHKFMLMYNYND
jgi:hypothetical protein